ncbi:hypothetical protein LJ737_14220 [Hymenobacter sp. 15J16-1T3B]|uniref:hypothetical protein n=1 Tax=Hymenobacter sp. 15J16-1T3B TaxID=2886941 RepID=UPI001D11E33C|nr:hypothetical protein [Hymenobacter sp. 15J16-1T3B]MCC3158401.1 hypothetical protein [Hymenobacter sp. 15J16-1T3B]
MTRADFQAAGFDYQPPLGDPLSWRMDDVRVYRHRDCPADGPQLYALWRVGEASYLLSTAADSHDTAAVLRRLPMREPQQLERAVFAFFHPSSLS